MNQSSEQSSQLKSFNASYGARFIYNSQYFDFFGKHVYCTKLSVPPYPELQIILLPNFPAEAPIFKLLPRLNMNFVLLDGVVTDQYLSNWNKSSSLSDVTRIILQKLEGNNSSNAKPTVPQPNKNEVDAVSRKVMDSLKGKSIDELLFVYYNLEQYSFDFFRAERAENEKLLNEVNDLHNQLKSRQVDFSAYQKEIEEKEASIILLQQHKSQYDKRFSKEEIVSKLGKYIDEKFYLPKNQLIADFHNKKIEYEEYKAKFKELTMNYYYYTIIKEKLDAIK